MKRIIVFAAFIISAVAFSSCKSDPVDPYIIGTGVIKENLEGYYVTIGMEKWPVTSIKALKIKEHEYSKSEEIAPVEGVLVTVFTSDNYAGVQAVLGEQNEEQIEALYYTNYKRIIIAGIIVFLTFFFVIALMTIEKL